MKKKSFSDWQEARRFRGIELFLKGWQQSAIAEALGVSRMSVGRWVHKFQNKGGSALQSVYKSGAPPYLSLEKKYQILEFLYPGAEAWGFSGDIWTCARIGSIIERQFGISYHSHHIAKIMKELNWTSHKPKVKASQQNEEAIRNWKNHTWPAIKKSQKGGKDSISPR